MALDNKGSAAEKAGMDRLKLEAKRASGPFVLFTLLMVAGLFTSAQIIRNLAGDKPWVSYEPYRVAFSDTKGVVPSRAELRLAGVKAGSIKKSELVNGQAVLTLNLEKKYAPMYRDAKVRIRPITPLEDMYVDILSRGTPAAGKLGKGDILPAQRTISPVQIGSVLDEFDKPTRTNLASLLNQLGRGLDDGGANLRWAFEEMDPFFRSATTVLGALGERRQNLKRFVTNFGGIAEELAKKDRQLAAFVAHGEEVLGTLSDNDGPFAATLAELPGTLSTMQRSFANLRATETVLDPALRSLRPVADKLPSGLDSLDTFAKDATPALQTLRTPVRELRPLARTLRPTADSLVGVFNKLDVQAPQLDKGVDMAIPCLDETGQLLSRVMSATKLGDVAVPSGAYSAANFRADLHIDFASLGEFTADPSWKRFVPCHYEDKVTGGDRIKP
ncbi:MAG: MCE-family protein Mce6D [Solirubrobacterales bacterium]|nr:MCE-family protein Mce6D [Solirubrobacterales bacterium]